MSAFLFREAQKFECRDCPSRCCRMPWRIEVTDGEKARFEADAWAAGRVAELGGGFVRMTSGGWSVPVVERDRVLRCAFLEEDGLCGLQKRHRHGCIPRVCQVFPFGFGEGEEGRVRVGLSHLCPSIRDNYGGAIGPQLEAKFLQAGGKAWAMADHMTTGKGVRVGRDAYLKVAGLWRKRLASGAPLAQTLADLHDATIQFCDAWEGEGGRGGQDVDGALAGAREAAHFGEDLAIRKADEVVARLLFAALLLPLSYPARVAPAEGRYAAGRQMGMARSVLLLALGRGE